MESPPKSMFATVGRSRRVGGGLRARLYTLMLVVAVVVAIVQWQWERAARARLIIVEVTLTPMPNAESPALESAGR